MATICSHFSVGELLHRRGVLDAGVVDEDVDAAEARGALLDHLGHLSGPRHVGSAVVDLDVVSGTELGHQRFDRFALTKAVEHDVSALRCERTGDPEPDAAGRAGHHCRFTLQHRRAPVAIWHGAR